MIFIPLATGDDKSLEKSRCWLVEFLQLTCIGNVLWSKHTKSHKIKQQGLEVLLKLNVTVACEYRTNEAKLS